jgi:hypothetical protein
VQVKGKGVMETFLFDGAAGAGPRRPRASMAQEWPQDGRRRRDSGSSK